MPVTLAQAQLNTQDDIQAGVIDEFRKSSFILDNLAFDQAVAPTGNGGTLTYGYTRVLAEAGAATRAINAEYVPAEATKQRVTVDLAVFGGSYQIDRVLAKNTAALVDEIVFQTQQHSKSTRSLFHDMFINGDTAVDPNAFDGLDAAVTGTTTECLPLANGFASGYLDMSTAADIAANAKAFAWLLDQWLLSFGDKPSALMGNSKLIAVIKAVAREMGYYTQSEDAFGRKVDNYDSIPLVDMGDKPASVLPVCPYNTRDTDGAGPGGNITGLADLFGCVFGLDAVHGVAPIGVPSDLVQVWLPDFSTAGAVKTGECEMVGCVAIKKTRGAGVLRNIKVQ